MLGQGYLVSQVFSTALVTGNALKSGTSAMLEVATASSCHWKLHGRIRGYSDENPLNQYDRAVISPYVRTSRK
jgi:hypothetical protein